ncbi:MAG: class I SAM-dependent methyltransferase [Longimicrobiales bacterium]|nr:class I SAM-dependent methyltransferase [Longimicrobiales bacterium]
MSDQLFDEHATEYDSWFLKNRNVLQSEVELLAGVLKDPGRALSVGCGSGLFEMILREGHRIDIHFGLEPASWMAEIAAKRGMEVKIGPAEELPFDDDSFDTVLLNGTPSYIGDLRRAFTEAYRVLHGRGHIVVADVPAESSYGTLYRLAAMVGSWDEPSLKAIAPPVPYPIEFAAAANWRTTQEKLDLLREVGFHGLRTSQTLTLHPKFSDEAPETPIPGHDRGDYVAILGRK